MSDREGRSGPSDDELSLPRATVAKMIQGVIFYFISPCIFQCVSSACCGRCTARDRLELTLTPLAPPEPRRDCLELLPDDVTCAKETRDLVIECCVGKTKILTSLWRRY